MKPTVCQFQYGQYRVMLETGMIARQATAAVMASMEDTTVLVTVVVAPEAKAVGNFVPLSVHYQERIYAAGRIPGGFFRREGRPTENEVLTSRLIDRPLRPLFVRGFNHEVQIIATVLSVNPQINPDIVAMIGASACLTLSGVPFSGPIGAARVGYINGEYVLNPTQELLKQSCLDLVVASTEQAVLMVESEADQLSESEMLEAVLFGQRQQQVVIEQIKLLAQQAQAVTWEWRPVPVDRQLAERVRALAQEPLLQAYALPEKQLRCRRLEQLRGEIVATLQSELHALENTGGTGGQGAIDTASLFELLNSVERRIVREQILHNRKRTDLRDPETVRALSMSIGVLPRTHGSALFTRGDTQALAVVTLGSERDAQTVDEMMGERTDHLLVHYNFPPYAVGEVGIVGSPKRREIGHGRLAKRALTAIMPPHTIFPYTVRIVSEITESNGSSSMATVCGASLALMDAGVPIKAAVAGIAMGLIKEEEQCIILSDILGDEDSLGDMDFKVAGTEKGITALQMDIKVNGINQEIMQHALQQAKGARHHILSVMQQAINRPRNDVSEFAPRIHTFKINPEKIKDVIGKGGSVIRALVDETGASIDVKDDGSVTIAAQNSLIIEQTVERIQQLTATVEKGATYWGQVSRIADFGAFVTLIGSKEGLVHISQLSDKRVEQVSDCVHIGQTVLVKVLEIDRQGRIRLTMKDTEEVIKKVSPASAG